MTPSDRPDPLREAEISAAWAALRHDVLNPGDFAPQLADLFRVGKAAVDRAYRAPSTPPEAVPTTPAGQPCGCTCCSGTWVLDAISYRCSGGCRCTARWYEGQPDVADRSTP